MYSVYCTIMALGLSTAGSVHKHLYKLCSEQAGSSCAVFRVMSSYVLYSCFELAVFLVYFSIPGVIISSSTNTF